MNRKLITLSNVAILLVLPVAALAFNPGGVPNAAPNLTINQLVDVVFSILWPIVVAFAIIMFILAAFLFMTAQGDPVKLQQARSAVIWGVVGVAVALLAFSIPFVIRNTIGQGI